MAQLTIENSKEYNSYAPRWARVRAILNGEARLKEIDLGYFSGAVTYDPLSVTANISFLRRINPTDTSDYNNRRNQEVIKGARLYNATVKTKSGLMGMLYRKPPTYSTDIPADLEYIFDNVDGSGISMNQQSRSVAGDVTSIGRDGLLVDMPLNDGTQKSKADVENGFRATIQEYKAESIIDYHETIINNVKVLDLVVLKEPVEVYADSMRIKREVKNQFKVYRLNQDGYVTVEMFSDSTDDKDNGLQQTDEVEITGASGERLTKIPFTFVGSSNNNPKFDSLPLEPISDINIGHYQESANLASSSFRLGHPQPWVASNQYMNLAKEKASKGMSVGLGDNEMVVVEQGGSFGFASAPENTLSKSIQKDFEEQMIALGAQLITSGGGVETAEAARIKHSSDVSDLQVIAENISNAYTKSIEFVCMFMGIEYKDYFFRLNDEFFEMKLSADDALKLVQVWQGGAINKAVLDANLIAGKVISDDVDLEEMNEAIELEQSASVNFDDEPNLYA